MADLAVTFPALLFVLAVQHRRIDTEALRCLAIAGAPLKVLARSADLPMWTRKLPPEAFGRLLTHLPRHETYARQIANHLPKRARQASRWLDNVSRACEYGDEAFAVWVARKHGTDRLHDFGMRQLALWAWFSVRPHLDRHGLLERRWSPEIEKFTARKASLAWRDRMSLHVTIGDAAIEPLWLEAKIVDGFDFVPLLSAKAIHDEARHMDNCVRSYGPDIATNEERLWSMRRDGKRVATLSVGIHGDLGLLTITQIKGPKNVNVPREVAIAAKRWIDSTDIIALEIIPKNWNDLMPPVKAWVEFFKPYWMERRRIPLWLPLVPRRSSLSLH